MREHKLERTGACPVVFEGSVVARSTGRRLGGKDHNRYHDITIYKTVGGRHVVHIEYITQWEGELNFSDVEVVDEPVEVTAFLQEYDPCSYVQGFPNRPQYAERQENLLNWLRNKFETQVADVLVDLDGAEERID